MENSYFKKKKPVTLETINYIRNAWAAITSTIISNCFRKAGYRCNRPVEVDESEDEFTKFLVYMFLLYMYLLF